MCPKITNQSVPRSSNLMHYAPPNPKAGGDSLLTANIGYLLGGISAKARLNLASA